MGGTGEELGDIHSHLVPGVDDGARTLAEGLEGVGRMVERGFGRIATTPHLDAGLTLDPSMFRAQMEEIEEAWGRLVGEVEKRWPELDLRLGFEVRLDTAEADFTDPRLRLGGTGFMLVEWPRMRVPRDATSMIGRLRFAGLRPIVAHPERYGGLDPDLGVVAEWREAGAYLQVNNGSLVGRYGARASKVAFGLLERGWVDYLSTDFHGRSHLALYSEEAEGRLRALDGEEHFALLAGANPLRIFDDEEPLPVPPLTRAGEGVEGVLAGRKGEGDVEGRARSHPGSETHRRE